VKVCPHLWLIYFYAFDHVAAFDLLLCGHWVIWFFVDHIVDADSEVLVGPFSQVLGHEVLGSGFADSRCVGVIIGVSVGCCQIKVNGL
jgi:hypothetical protein